MKYTLLEIVQLILASLEDDEVDSINDTETALTVAGMVKQCFFDIVGRADLPEHYDFFELNPSGDTTRPTVMYLPSTALNINSLKYNNFTTGLDDGVRYLPVTYLSLTDFLDHMDSISTDNDETNVLTFQDTVGTATIDFVVYNDKHPEYYTTANNNTLYFDSFMLSEDAFLVGNKTRAYGLTVPGFDLDDSYIPDLDAQQFQLLINEAKALAHYDLKQTLHPKAEKTARNNWISIQKRKKSIPYPYSGLNNIPNYGRK